jgi:hypothetical protein
MTPNQTGPEDPEQNNGDIKGKVGTKGEHTAMTPLPIATHPLSHLISIVAAAIRPTTANNDIRHS